MGNRKGRKTKYDFHDLIIFLLIFNLLAIPLYIAMINEFSYTPLQELNAQLLHGTLRILGYNSNISGYSLLLTDKEGVQNIEVSWDSTGWKSMYAIAALVISSQVSNLSRRIKFAIFGVAIVFVLNYLRITTTILASLAFGFNVFDVVHTLLWREGLILAVVAIWFGWLIRERNKYKKVL